MTLPSFTYNFKLKRFLRHLSLIFLFLAGLFVIDRSIFLIADHFYAKVNNGSGRLNFIGENQYNILIMGSSTAKAFDDDAMSSGLNRSVLNVSLDGSSLLYSRCLLEYILYHKVKPNVILLNVDLFEVLDSAWGGNYYSNVEKFLPVYGEIKYIDRMLEKESIFEKIKFLSKSYRFNNITLSILRKGIVNRDNNNIYHREQPSDIIMSIPIEKEIIKRKFSSHDKINQRKIDLYEEMITTCNENNIRIIFIETPVYYPSKKMIQRDKISENIIAILCQKYNIPFLIFSQDTHPVFQSNTLFQDILHLNKKGGYKFSRLLIEKLKSTLSYSSFPIDQY